MIDWVESDSQTPVYPRQMVGRRRSPQTSNRARRLPAGPARTGTSGARICFIEDPDGNKIELAELNATSRTRQAAARERWLRDFPEEAAGAR